MIMPIYDNLFLIYKFIFMHLILFGTSLEIYGVDVIKWTFKCKH